MSVNEWLGFGAAACMAGALVSLFLWISGCSRGLEKARLRRLLITLWVAVVACIAGLVVVRVVLGGGVLDMDAHAESVVSVRELAASQWALVAVGLAWTGLWMTVALRVAGAINAPPAEE